MWDHATFREPYGSLVKLNRSHSLSISVSLDSNSDARNSITYSQNLAQSVDLIISDVI